MDNSFEIDPVILLEKNITMDDINFAIKNSYKDEVTCVFTDYNSEKLIFEFVLTKFFKIRKSKNTKSS